MCRYLSASAVYLGVVVFGWAAQSEVQKSEYWFRVHLASRPVYEVTVKQENDSPDLSVAVFLEARSGGVSLAGAADDWTGDETVLLSHVAEGDYLICVRSHDNPFAVDDFRISIMAPLGDGGHVLVFAEDLIELGNPPPEAQAILDGGVETVSFGTNHSISFTYLTPGVHTIQVSVAAGYAPSGSRDTPNEHEDPDSPYGNPRHVVISNGAWEASTFDFLPLLRTTAIVRDAWTMERLADVPIEFVATSGWITNEVYRKHPNYATYSTNWGTCSDGRFPEDVYLPAVNWDMRITNACYETLYVTNAITNCAAGGEIDLGTILIVPVDSNTNGIGDKWEGLCFGEGSNVNPNADCDGDWCNNRQEYITGTHPTNPVSILAIDQFDFDMSNGTVTLSWPVEAWRTYSLQATDLFNATSVWWQVTDTTWEATNGQTRMTYVDHELDDFNYYNYRVRVVPYDYEGNTNRVLHPRPPLTGGSGSGTNGPPLPPGA